MTYLNNSDSRGSVPPQYIRPPLPGQHCPHSGLGRAMLYQLVKEGKVEAVVMRRPGAKRGITLISYASLMAHLATFTKSAAA